MSNPGLRTPKSSTLGTIHAASNDDTFYSNMMFMGVYGNMATFEHIPVLHILFRDREGLNPWQIRKFESRGRKELGGH